MAGDLGLVETERMKELRSQITELIRGAKILKICIRNTRILQ